MTVGAVLMMAVACGGGAKDRTASSPEPVAKKAAPDCSQTAQHLSTMPDHDPNGFEDTFRTCIGDQWSEAMRRCLATASNTADVKTCMAKPDARP